MIIGGLKSIARVTGMLVPFRALTYVLGSLTVIFLNADRIPWAVSAIASEAFNPTAMSGGLLGVFPRDTAHRLVATLHKDGQTAAIIGTLDFTNTGVHLTGKL